MSTRTPGAIRSAHVLTLLVFIYILMFTTAWGHSRHLGIAAPGEPGTPNPSTTDKLAPVSVPEPSSEAMEYYRTGNWLWTINRLWALIVPGLFAFSGLSARLRTLARRLGHGWFLTIGLYIVMFLAIMYWLWTINRLWALIVPAVFAFSGLSARLRNLARRLGNGWFLTVGWYIVMFLAIMYLLDFPLSFYQGFVRQHAYGLSNQTLGRWLRNTAVRLVVDMGVAFALMWVPYLLMARSPRRWWLYLAMLSVPFLFVTMLIVPVFYDPLFNKFGPMKNKELERSILSLASRSGIEGSRVFEVDKSADTNAVNAYVTGFWQTKRIVLWDTTIKKLTEPELLVVMGHEMGHYALGHVVRSILLSSIVTLIGLFLVDRVGRWVVHRYCDRLGFDLLADIASVPLMIMLLEAAFLLLSPVGLAYSRYQEHEADRYALDLTRNNHAAGTAHVKLLTENLSNPRPGLLYKIFRASHPSAGERIDFANSYHPWRRDQAPNHEIGHEKPVIKPADFALTPQPGPEKNSRNPEMEAPLRGTNVWFARPRKDDRE